MIDYHLYLSYLDSFLFFFLVFSASFSQMWAKPTLSSLPSKRYSNRIRMHPIILERAIIIYEPTGHYTNCIRIVFLSFFWLRLKSSQSSRQCVGLLDMRPQFNPLLNKTKCKTKYFFSDFLLAISQEIHPSESTLNYAFRHSFIKLTHTTLWV